MRRLLSIVVGTTLLACTQSTEPIGTTDIDLNVVRQSLTAPPLLAARDSFWAKFGEAREFRMYYQGAQPGDTGAEFLLFEVPGDGLLRRPDGLIFRTGDSILITVRVEDPARFRFEVTPAKLLFNTANPARLRLRYASANHDFDNDGDQDPADTGIEQDLDIWYRADAGTLWFRQHAVKFEQQDEISVNVRAAAHYAVGW
jgi:hypothetical protein